MIVVGVPDARAERSEAMLETDVPPGGVYVVGGDGRIATGV
jgi:hypothetical protein